MPYHLNNTFSSHDKVYLSDVSRARLCIRVHLLLTIQQCLSASMAAGLEHTLAMIKPDAVSAGKADEIQLLAEMHGFTVVRKRTMQACGTLRRKARVAACERISAYCGRHKQVPITALPHSSMQNLRLNFMQNTLGSLSLMHSSRSSPAVQSLHCY